MYLSMHLGPIDPSFCILDHTAGGVVGQVEGAENILPCSFGHKDSAVSTQQSDGSWTTLSSGSDPSIILSSES